MFLSPQLGLSKMAKERVESEISDGKSMGLFLILCTV
jgi:hypothetical protein